MSDTNTVLIHKVGGMCYNIQYNSYDKGILNLLNEPHAYYYGDDFNFFFRDGINLYFISFSH